VRAPPISASRTAIEYLNVQDSRIASRNRPNGAARSDAAMPTASTAMVISDAGVNSSRIGASWRPAR
jgi:hypothetical protein